MVDRRSRDPLTPNDGRSDVYYADSGAEAAPNPPGFHDTLVLSTPGSRVRDAYTALLRESYRVQRWAVWPMDAWRRCG
jgi:hypothetical protein